MSELTIVSNGRRGNTIVPNFRWEDARLDPYDLRIAGWIASHSDSYRSRVSRNEISRRTGVSLGKVTLSLQKLETLGIVTISRANGNPVRIVLNVEVWEDDRSPSGLVPDHDVTGTRPLGDHIEEQLEEQEKPSAPTSSKPGNPLAVEAQSIVKPWWEERDVKPATSFIAIAKIVERCLKGGWSREDLEACLRETQTFTGAAFDMWRSRRAEAEARNPGGPRLSEEDIDLVLTSSAGFFAQRDLMAWRHEHVAQLRATIRTMHNWKYDLGETMIRIGIAARRPSDMIEPSKLAKLPRVERFPGMPPGDLSEAMETAYRLLSWRAS